MEFGEWYDPKAAAAAEAATIEGYRKRGWTIRNRNKAGALGGQTEIWTFEACKKLAEKYKTVAEFTNTHPSAYTVATRKRWWPKISQHMERRVEHGKWTLEVLITEASKYSTRKEFRTKNPRAYGATVEKNILDKVCGHMVRLIKPSGYWTKTRILKEAKQFNTRSEFKSNSSTAYGTARKKGWLEEACSHMQLKQKPRGYWTLDNIKIEAKKYNTRGEFVKGSVSAYSIAARNNWLDEACSHMLESAEFSAILTLPDVGHNDR